LQQNQRVIIDYQVVQSKPGQSNLAKSTTISSIVLNLGNHVNWLSSTE